MRRQNPVMIEIWDWHSTILKKLFSFSRGCRRALDVNGLNNFRGEFRFFLQRLFRGVPALADERAVELQPRAFLVHRAAVNAHVENAAFLVNAVVADDVE